MFVPGSAELFNMEEDAELSGRNPRLEQHPELAKFFERMTYVPLAGKTHLLPPGGGGVGMHVIPVEKPSRWRTRRSTSSIFPTG